MHHRPERSGLRRLSRVRGALRRRHEDEDGSGVVTSTAGVLIFLGFLLLAAQVTIHLYGTSTATTVAFNAARRVAAADGAYGCDQATADVRERLGAYGARPDVAVDCQAGGDVVVRVSGPSPARLLAGFGRLAGMDTLDRTVRVRAELLVGATP